MKKLMKKYFDIVGLLPLTIIAMCFLKNENDVNNHLKKTCVSSCVNLIIFFPVYFILLFFNVNKWISITIALLLWFIFTFLQKKYIIS